VKLSARLCDEYGISAWRQAKFLLKKLRNQKHYCEKLKHSTSKDPLRQSQKIQDIKDAHTNYLGQAIKLTNRVSEMTQIVLGQKAATIMTAAQTVEVDKFTADARHQISLVERRVLRGEIIPHEDKIFSIFEPHSEWICKGKAGTPQELGLRVGIVEDHQGFILTHMVMEKAVDSTVAGELISDAKNRFPKLHSCSTDKGFWSPENHEKLKAIIPVPAIPKKGRLSQADREWQESEEFQKARKKHQAVESAINALENHGLDYCPDHGIKGFKRYVALAVLARNIQKLGAELQKQEQAKLKRSQAIKAGIKGKKEAICAA
jgi:transposase, IS5 family